MRWPLAVVRVQTQRATIVGVKVQSCANHLRFEMITGLAELNETRIRTLTKKVSPS
jgi:hypothetical protein